MTVIVPVGVEQVGCALTLAKGVPGGGGGLIIRARIVLTQPFASVKVKV